MTDIKIQPTLDSKGQVPLVSGPDNVHQAIKHQLLTELDTYIESCDNHGSELKSMIGQDLDEPHIEFIKMEIELTVLKDPRVATCQVEHLGGSGFQYYYNLIDDDTDYMGEIG